MNDANKSMEIVRMLKQVMDSIKQSVRKEFEDMNLTAPQGMIIGMLSHEGKMKISDLSKRIGLSNSTISGIVDRLEKQGFVERIRSEKDRRVVYVDVNSEFRKNSKDRFCQIQRKMETVISKTSDEEADKILEGLSILKEVVDRENF
ncbi:MarR family winged helix-turn-helix transcriptional regulator [Haloimpatiens lingqiaonensis]|uniref:MarR family winged helix-turn-helix transcriptional regulator n=1 Tax=Haloimpatiens lingqiaonensis TaxID=1380675 RepID=UPI0010FF0FE3|nr:MarR family transcriptional regulator [Haloimpatiens lingqiaonensis]